jgi:RNA polymerase sigma factor (sigma-70 family)
MKIERSRLILRQIDLLWRSGTAAGLTDGQLLERFATRPDAVGEAAFAALVDRHGPMVLGVCRGLLRDPNDAEDAFQATFLTLAQRARSIGMPDLLGPWLHGVARRKAGKLRQQITRRRGHEAKAAAQAGMAHGGGPGWYEAPMPDLREQSEVLHEEIGRLPGKYRRPIVLCYLEGLTHDEAARQLGWPVGTVRGRLARARAQLGARLIGRGLAVSGGVPVALTRPKIVSSAVPAGLAGATTRAATRLVAGRAVAEVVTATVATLIGRGPRAWLVVGPKSATALLFAIGVTAAGVCALHSRSPGDGPVDANEAISTPSGRTHPLTADSPQAPRDRGGQPRGEVSPEYPPDRSGPAAQREDSPGKRGRRLFLVSRQVHRRRAQKGGEALAHEADRPGDGTRNLRSDADGGGPTDRQRDAVPPDRLPAGIRDAVRTANVGEITQAFRAGNAAYEVHARDGDRVFMLRFSGPIEDGLFLPNGAQRHQY